MTYRSRGEGTGNSAYSIGQVSITHPTPVATTAVTGAGDSDLNPVTYAASYVPVLGDYGEILTSGGGFAVEPDGRMLITKSGIVKITAYADVAHSANGATVGAVFAIERSATTVLSSRAVHTKVPNNGDIGNISGVGIFTAVAGDKVGIAVASDVTGNVSISASSLVFEMQ